MIKFKEKYYENRYIYLEPSKVVAISEEKYDDQLPFVRIYTVQDTFRIYETLEEVLGKVDNILLNIDKTIAMGRDIAYQVGEKKRIAETMDNLAIASDEGAGEIGAARNVRPPHAGTPDLLELPVDPQLHVLRQG